MKKIFFGTALAMYISGCAQPGFRADIVSQPTTKNHPSCQLSVRFSGQPEEVRGGLGDQISKEMGGKPDGPVWIYASELQGVPKRELSLCVCPKEPKFSELKAETTRSSPYSKFVEGIGHVNESPVTEVDGGAKAIMKFTLFPDSVCFLAQVVIGTGAPEAIRSIASPFLSSTAPILRDTKGVGLSPTVRLRQLEALREEKLISEDEFKARRTLILESL